MRVVALVFAMTVLALLLAGLPSRDARVRPVQQVWSVVTLWDAAAVSLAEDRLGQLLVRHSLTLDELRCKFVDFSNTTVYELGEMRHSLRRASSAEERTALLGLGVATPKQPSSCLFRSSAEARRAALRPGSRVPAHQVLALCLARYGDNPDTEAPGGALNQRAVAWLQWSMGRPLFAGWIYLLLAVAVMLVSLLSARRTGLAGLSMVVAGSALAYALSLAIASGSAEFRYLAWPIWASLAALALLLATRFRLRNET